jgi:GT2 family glycosyltransferase
MIDAYEVSDKKTILAGNIIVKSTDTPSLAELYDVSLGFPQERYVKKGYAVTANLAIPKVIFDNIGIFDSTRFSGGDADFCKRALKQGYRLKFIPEATVFHPARKSWSEYVTKVRRTKGGQIRAGKISRRVKFFLITLIPPLWRFWRVLLSDRLKLGQKFRVMGFQLMLWIVEMHEAIALLLGKTPERQ